MKNYSKSFLIFFSSALIFSPSLLFAQNTPLEEIQEQKIVARENQQEAKEQFAEYRQEKRDKEKEQRVQEVLEQIKTKAKEKIREKRRKELLDFALSIDINFAHDTNPLSNSDQKGDQNESHDFSVYWTPKFTKTFSAKIGYALADTNYLEQYSLDSVTHTAKADWKYQWGKWTFNQGEEYELSISPYDQPSNTATPKLYFKWKTKFGAYTYSGKYENTRKVYYKKVPRDSTGTSLDFDRVDFRNAMEMALKREIFWKLTAEFKGKTYRNNGNDEFLAYNDYDTHKGTFTLSRTFLKDGALFASYNSDFELKRYHDRVTPDFTARWDKTVSHNLNFYYTVMKDHTLSLSHSYKKANSNDATGKFKNVNFKLGYSIDF